MATCVNQESLEYMLTNINTQENKQRVAVIAVGYNRYKSLKRLLDSVESASYPVANVPLIISIDCSGDESVYELARSFKWSHGEKYVNIEDAGRLGLVKHIYQCAGLTKVFRAIILLEDDLFVSPFFYSYVLQAIDKYGDAPAVAQIALYHNETNGFVGHPYPKVNDGFDVFLAQSTCSWGQCWNERMWNAFCTWRDHICTDELINEQDMPATIKGWTRAWSRYFNAYILHQNKYVLYPQVSLTTNFSDAGEHGDDNNNIVQVNLQQGDFLYRMPGIQELQRYDSFGNNEGLYAWLSMKPYDVCLDIFGIHERKNQRYILSTRLLPYKIVKTFALNMRPIELNVKFNIPGKGLYLYDTDESGKGSYDYSKYLGDYYFQRLNSRLMLKYLRGNIISRVKRKIRKIFNH